METRAIAWLAFGSVLVATSSTGCNSLLGLDDLTIGTRSSGDGGGGQSECTTNAQCVARLTADAGGAGPDDGVVAAVCVKPAGKCVPLRSQDCGTVTGDFRNENAIVIGSMFQTTGAQAATNLARQQSAMLAVDLINEAGGVPAGDSSQGRPLVLVSCDGSADLERAGHHLATDLQVPAIVGPNNSQDTLDLSSKVTIGKGTVVMTPTAVASSITALLDDDLTWLMVPSDVQRAAVMIPQIGELEAQLKREREVNVVKLGVAFRDDALGIGTRTSLNELVLNGKSLVDPINLGRNVRIDPYDPAAPNQDAVVAGQAALAPDIVVLAGTAEAITRVMVPLEAAWDPAKPRPHYILIDPAKVPELLSAAENDDLRRRVRGTGIVSGTASKPVFDAFRIDYGLRFQGQSTTISGMGPSYDAVFAIAFALAATTNEPVTGRAVSRGLRRLAGGSITIQLQSTQIRSAFQALAGGEKINAIGTFCPLDWDQNGAVRGGTLEMWCIGVANGKPAFGSSGLTYDIAAGKFSGEYVPCSP